MHNFIVFFVDLITKSLRSNNAWERTRLKASVIDAYFTKKPQNSHFVHDHTTTRYPNKINFLHLELFCIIAPQSRKTPCWRFLIQSQNQNKKFLRTSEIADWRYFFLKVQVFLCRSVSLSSSLHRQLNHILTVYFPNILRLQNANCFECLKVSNIVETLR